MDQLKIGKFIAQLRRRDGLTQQALGEKLGVTNKTVSRWENGNYMPDIEILQLLGKEFNVSINELLSGEFLNDEEFKQKAEENIMAVAKESLFSVDEKKVFWKRKWRKDHIGLLILLVLTILLSIVVPFIIDKQWLIGLSPLVAFIAYGYQNNKMMAYVEKNLYEGIE